MQSLTDQRGWFVLVPLTLFIFLVWDVSSRLIAADREARQQFVRGFEVDASRREGMRDLLGRDVQSAVMYALHSLSDVETLPTNGERAKRLMSAFERLGFALRNSRYDFVEVFLTEQTFQDQLVLRGRYPSAVNLGEIDPSQTPLFAHVDRDNMTLFRQYNKIYDVEGDPLLVIAEPQPVLVTTRKILEGDDTFSSWYLSLRVGIRDIHESIDLIGQQMAGGTTPMRIINFDAQSDNCLTVWEVGKGGLDCNEEFLTEPVTYKTTYDTEVSKELTYSIYQATEAYRQLRAAPSDSAASWRPFVPAFLAFILLLTTLRYLRYRVESENLMSSFTRSLSAKDSLNSSIHEALSSHLEMMTRFTYAMRQNDIEDEARRYFDIATSEFLEAGLRLNTLVLERSPVEEYGSALGPVIDLKELTELAQMALEVAAVDTPVETQFFVPDDLPSEISGHAYSVQTAVVAAIYLSAQATEHGRIEVSIWVDSEETSPCLHLRVIDTGLGWGDLSDTTDSRAATDDDTALRALVSCLKFSNARLETQSETELGNEYVLKFCAGA